MKYTGFMSGTEYDTMDQRGCLFVVMGELSESSGTVEVNVWFADKDEGQAEMNNKCYNIGQDVSDVANKMLPHGIYIDDVYDCKCATIVEDVAQNDSRVAIIYENDECTVIKPTEDSVKVAYRGRAWLY